MSIKKFRITLNGVAHEVEVEELSSQASVASRPAPVQSAPAAAPVAPATPAPKAAPAAPAPSSDGTYVSAPLQGVIQGVSVSKGQSVKTGDVLVVIEAMKMENEVVAPVNGTVDFIGVNKGDSVVSGDLLLIIK